MVHAQERSVLLSFHTRPIFLLVLHLSIPLSCDLCVLMCDRKILVVRSLRSGGNRRCERRACFVERENAGVDIVHHAYAVRASPPYTVLIPLSSSQ